MKATTIGVACMSFLLGGDVVVSAQTASTPPTVALPPTNVLLPNYAGVPIGEVAGLEAGAFIARANDSSSGFYNPAGLALAEKTSVSGGAGMYQFNLVGADPLGASSYSFQQVPAMFAFTLKNLAHRQNLSAGFSIARTNAWQQAVDFARTTQVGSATDRVSYSSEAEMDAWLGSLGVGYASAGKWRAGASLDAQYTGIDRRQALADQYRTSTGLAALSITSRGESWIAHLRFTAGAQFDLTPSLKAGVVVRSRGLSVWSSGLSMLEGESTTAATTITASFLDDDLDVSYRLPLEFKTGLAFTGSRGQAEFDLLVFSGTGEYRAFESNQSVTVLVDAGNGNPPSATDYAANPSTIHTQAVADIALGGRLNLTSNGSWTLHAGYGTDRSPVGPNDSYFTKVNLQKLTAGVSGRTSRFLGSIGLQYLTGQSDPIALRELPAGQLSTTLTVHSFGLVYSLSVTF